MFSKLLLTYLRRFPFDQGKNWIKARFFADRFASGEIEYKNTLGCSFRLNLEDHVQRAMFFHDIYEKNTFRHIRKLIRGDFVMLDCGANIGAYAVNLASRLPRGKVYAFEPNPKTFLRLNENIRLNAAKNIVAVPLGLSDREEQVTLYAPSLTTASVYKHQGADEHFTIHMTTIDAYCREKGINRVDFIKIDIEGGEWKCLDGAEETFVQNPAIILQVELDSNCESAGHTKQQLFDRIRKLGFTAWQPRGFPFAMSELKSIPDGYEDNVIFTRGRDFVAAS